MILSGQRIKDAVDAGDIVIEPWDPQSVGANSYDVRLHEELLVYDELVLDMKRQARTKRLVIPVDGLVLSPGELYLGRTVEYTETRRYVPMLEGRSSVGRLGLSLHVTAGVGDKNFCGHWTTEMTVVRPLRVYAGTRVGQLIYHDVDELGGGYRGKYLNGRGTEPGPSRLWQDFAGGGACQ